MDRQPKRLIEQLQNIQLRQRRVIQQLQAEDARLLSDLAHVRQERDAFRGKAGLARKDNVELHNRLKEAMTEYQDLKRGRAMMVRFVTTAADAHRRSAVGCLWLSSKEFSVDHAHQSLNILPVLNEGQNESSPTAETTATTNIASTPLSRSHSWHACADKH
ncbi:hypothetical protein J3R82DRAFT_6753 [Butyriboletus roseoflavus]|nr:hypothetical protein J3R82DRAFT_6753 [Butyriboletus roseoflavus]